MNRNLQRHSATTAIERRIGPKSKTAKVSDYLYSIDEFDKQHPRFAVVLYLRVSERTQEHKGNLRTQEKYLRKEAKKGNHPVLGCFCEVCSGTILHEDRTCLNFAIEEAKRLSMLHKQTVAVLALSPDRFLRNIDYTTKKPDLLPTEFEFETLKKRADGCILVTALHPDMSALAVRGFQSKLGQIAKNSRGGRPRERKPGYKKQFRLRNIGRVVDLHRKGATWGEIVQQTGLNRCNVRRWVKKYS